MLKVVKNKSTDNVVDFPRKCEAHGCRYAETCPMRKAFDENPDMQVTSGLFVGASNGKASVNGLSSVTDEDVRPMTKIVAAALRQLSERYRPHPIYRLFGHNPFLRLSRERARSTDCNSTPTP